jgi:hypothetical protein
MSNRLDALTVRTYRDRDGNEKTSFTKIGAAFGTKNGWVLSLDALPLPTMGERGLETKILLMPPKPRDDAPRSSGRQDYGSASGGRPSSGDLDDEIPFAPEFR